MLLHDQTEATDGDRTQQREGWPAGDQPPKPNTLAGAVRAMTADASTGSDTKEPKKPS